MVSAWRAGTAQSLSRVARAGEVPPAPNHTHCLQRSRCAIDRPAERSLAPAARRIVPTTLLGACKTTACGTSRLLTAWRRGKAPRAPRRAGSSKTIRMAASPLTFAWRCTPTPSLSPTSLTDCWMHTSPSHSMLIFSAPEGCRWTCTSPLSAGSVISPSELHPDDPRGPLRRLWF